MSIKSEKSKELQRIKKFLSRNTKRGFQWKESFIGSLQNKSLKQLKSLTPSTLYAKSTAISPISGVRVKGTQAQKEYKSLSAKKGWETRRKRDKEYWEKRRAERPQAQATPSVNLEAYDRIMEMIDEQPLKTASIILRDFLAKEMAKYEGKNGHSGFYWVTRGLASASEEAINLVQMALDDSKGGRLRRAISKLGQIIKGSMLDEEEAKEIGEAMDKDEWIDDEFVEADEDELPFI